jgi:catechol 2,3-dioxygenase
MSQKIVPIDPGVRIGHVHLKVADLERALKFYCGVLGFELQQRFGTQAAFISAGGYHHHIGLNTWESAGGSPPPPRSTGLYHLAILYPTRALLADALRRLIAAGVELDGAADHGVSEALYLRDPDENGVELYWDRPGKMAAHARRRTGDVHPRAGFGRIVERSSVISHGASPQPDFTFSISPRIPRRVCPEFRR